MPPNTTTWPLENHTLGKHRVLKNYMDAWLPIMTRYNGRVLFIDAFAGPGEFTGGEPGSPIIALRALMGHNARDQMRSDINYIFIEENVGRCNHLKNVLADLEHELPINCNYKVINSTFDETLTQVLNDIDEQNARLAPSFVMIDPFGVSGTPMETIERILNNPKSEVYISFMARDINRFRGHTNFEHHLDALFGCSEWRQSIDMPDGEDRISFLYNLYKSQLKVAGANQVLHFELYEGNRLVYAIFFGTGNLEGCNKMKQSIWKVDPFGDFRFHSDEAHQTPLFNVVPDMPLRNDLLREFGNGEWIEIQDIISFAKSDRTRFHDGHLKTRTLKPMEDAGEIEVKPGTRRRRGTYPNATILRFL